LTIATVTFTHMQTLMAALVALVSYKVSKIYA